MLRPLPSRRRRAIVRSALWTCAGALALLPIAPPWTLQAQDDPPLPHARPLPAKLEAFRYPHVVIVRDPFSGDAGDGAAAGPDGAPERPLLRAVILGPRARALVDVGGSTQLVSIGGRIGTGVVTAIDRDGITFDDGRRLALSAEPHS
ncbi:MAG TPA: hypothetical protein VMF61_08910 [Candidatus Acidoferrales bacterium]|nr:hypothetical protein [Candidatus Acidoferrales bacterium]